MSANEIPPYSPPKDIVIIGGGVIGCTSACYLSRHPRASSTKVTILEAGAIAGGASGKYGGLVAKWVSPKELVDVAFAEHVALAEEHGGEARWGWRILNCGWWRGRVGCPRRRGKKADGVEVPEDLDWLDSGATEAYRSMAGDGETAQVHPYLFTTSMLALAQEKGVKLIKGRATSIQYTEDSQVSGVNYVDSNGADGILTADTIILSAGPWTPTLLPQVPIWGHRAHSITILPSQPVSPYFLFTSFTYPVGDATGTATRTWPGTRTAGPDILTCPNNEVFVCAAREDSEPLPDGTKDVVVDEKVCDQLVKDVGMMSKPLRDGEVTMRQACYLANAGSGNGCPIVGRVEGIGGLVVAAGHASTGVCNAPGTAKAISELLIDGEITCADLSRLAPKNFF
ncbi:FAD dependent oxidoreductase [Rickenella mellea]|uniref:FAD dependent oxidoreductase n=1 Tax=Rickenella mellea TaxID=50990 RepID=A0A4Y7PMN8_9AGAM|nr:FAD dependent oxidoreductase [Rickenella mellea]